MATRNQNRLNKTISHFAPRPFSSRTWWLMEGKHNRRLILMFTHVIYAIDGLLHAMQLHFILLGLLVLFY